MRITRSKTNRLSQAMEAVVAARKDRDEAENRLKLAEAELLDALTEAGRKSTSIVDGDKVYRGTFVSNDKVSIDEAGLKRAVGAENWKKISRSVLDRKKLEQAIADGTLVQETVGAYVTVSKTKPYIRFTESVRKEDEGENDD